jgi:hypothetical protein
MRGDVCEPDASFAGVAGAFAGRGGGVSPAQRTLVADAAGLADLLEPPRLRECLEAAERLDRVGVAAHPQTGGMCFSVPKAPLRALRRAFASIRAGA